MGLGGGSGAGAGRGPFALLGTEVCATLLLLCWLCCWPDDTNSDTSSPEYPRKPVLVESRSRRRSGEPFSRRIGSSAVSLHLPSTSGYAKQPLSAHRSHEEIRSRRKSHHETVEPETRYHSAPSVIDEVIHRRDWERSTKDLYIPLKPESECLRTGSTPSLSKAPFAEVESSSVECLKADNNSLRVCKKHYTNIKSSKGKKCKESNKHDIKDTDATEAPTGSFYIGDEQEHSLTRAATGYEEFIEHERLTEERNRSIYKAKDAKQSFNESIRLKEMPRKGLVPLEEGEVRYGFALQDDLDRIDSINGIDRSGAVHHTIESRTSLRHYPAPSVEIIGYEGGACYLAEVGSVSELRASMTLSPHAHAALYARADAASRADAAYSLAQRARHASDGDILAPPLRPESGAFSESDLDLELESEELPPAYDEVQRYAAPQRKETAI